MRLWDPVGLHLCDALDEHRLVLSVECIGRFPPLLYIAFIAQSMQVFTFRYYSIWISDARGQRSSQGYMWEHDRIRTTTSSTDDGF